MDIPREFHGYLLGHKGKRLSELELSTSTKITIPRQIDNSNEVKITGTKEAVEKARHEIQLLVDEQVTRLP